MRLQSNLDIKDQLKLDLDAKFDIFDIFSIKKFYINHC